MDDLPVGVNATHLADNIASPPLRPASASILFDEDLIEHPQPERRSRYERTGGNWMAASSDLEIEPGLSQRGHPPQDCVWAVTIDNRAVGSVSISHHASHVARVNIFRIHPAWQHTAVLAKLIERVHRYCWNHGYLKLVLESHAAPAVVRTMLAHRGFHLVRRRRILGHELLEYYVDLYFPPRQEESLRP